MLALYELMRGGSTQIEALLTTITEDDERIAMHGVRRELLLQQARSIGYPLHEVPIPPNCNNDEYEKRMQKALEKYRESEIEYFAFGDLFLEDIRAYREHFLKRIGMKGIFPLWKRNTAELARQFIQSGFRAVIVCVDTETLAKEFAGRELNQEFLNALPQNVDPCGENGEFHTFVYDGPTFSEPVRIELGQKSLRHGRFYYCDLLPASSVQP